MPKKQQRVFNLTDSCPAHHVLIDLSVQGNRLKDMAFIIRRTKGGKIERCTPVSGVCSCQKKKTQSYLTAASELSRLNRYR